MNKDVKKSVAYIAIEDKKWPPVNDRGETGGPFYLIWENPELSKINGQSWPFMLSGFEVKNSLKATYPKIFPDSKISKNSSIYKGFEVFVTNCFVCHQINGQGEGLVGPDLNHPMSR